jgi:hypothetical protein
VGDTQRIQKQGCPLFSLALSFQSINHIVSPLFIQIGNSYNVLFSCKSSCQNTVDSCRASFELMGMTDMLPNCAAAIPDTGNYPGGAVEFQNDGSCNSLPSKFFFFLLEEPRSLYRGNNGWQTKTRTIDFVLLQ